MEHGGTSRRYMKRSLSKKLLAISLGIVAVASPLFVDRKRQADYESELEEEPLLSISTYLPLLLLVLIITVAFSCYLDQSLTRFDPYWIYRVSGSSGGIIMLLIVLAFVLKCKAFEV